MKNFLQGRIRLLPEGDGEITGTSAHNALAKLLLNMGSTSLDIGINAQGGIQIEKALDDEGGGGGLDYSFLPFGAYDSGGSVTVNEGDVVIGGTTLTAMPYSVTSQDVIKVSVFVYSLSGELHAMTGQITDLPGGSTMLAEFGLCYATASSVYSRMWLGGNISMGGIWV